MTVDCLVLASHYRTATVFTDSDDCPSFADITGSFVCARMMCINGQLPEGCTPQTFDQLGACSKVWQPVDEPSNLPRVEAAASTSTATSTSPRDVSCFSISGAKEKAPAAAKALLRRLA